MDVAAVRLLVLAVRCQLFLCHLFTRCDGASACNPARTPPVEPTRPQTNYIIASVTFDPCPDCLGTGSNAATSKAQGRGARLDQKEGPGSGFSAAAGASSGW